MKNLKKLFVVFLTAIIVLAYSNIVLAEDDDSINSIFGDSDSSSQQSSSNSEDEDFTELTSSSNSSNSSNTNSNNSNTNTNSSLTTNSNTNSNTNRSVSNTNQLAKTGIENNGGIIALFVLICGISAIYSYKKVNEYKSL